MRNKGGPHAVIGGREGGGRVDGWRRQERERLSIPPAERERERERERAVINFGDELLRFDTPFFPSFDAGTFLPSLPPSVGNVLATGGAPDRSLVATRAHRNAHQQNGGGDGLLPPLLFPFFFLAMAASAFLPSDASVTTCIVVAAVADGWAGAGGWSGTSAASRCCSWLMLFVCGATLPEIRVLMLWSRFLTSEASDSQSREKRFLLSPYCLSSPSVMPLCCCERPFCDLPPFL